MNIGIDIDGVIADADSSFRNYMKRTFRRDFPHCKVTSFKYEECFEFTEYEFKLLMDLFKEESLWLNMELIKGAKEAILGLSRNANIVIATARPPKMKDITTKWLNKNNIPYNEIYFTEDKKHLLPDSLDYKLDYFLEDHPEFAYNLADKGINVLLFGYPWNKSVKEHPKIKRISGWKEALNIINE